MQEQERREFDKRKDETEDESVKNIVEVCLATSQNSAQGLEIDLMEAQKRIKHLEERLLSFREDSAWLMLEAKKVQELKNDVEKKENTIANYRKAMVLRGRKSRF